MNFVATNASHDVSWDDTKKIPCFTLSFYTATGFAPFLSAPFQTFKPPTNRLMDDWLELTAGGGGGAYGGGTAINEKIRQWW